MVNTCFDTGFDRTRPERPTSRHRETGERRDMRPKKSRRGWLYIFCMGLFCLGLLAVAAATEDARFVARSAILADAAQAGTPELPLITRMSDAVLRRVVEAQGLVADPEFVPQQRNWLTRIEVVLGWSDLADAHETRLEQAALALRQAVVLKTAQRNRLEIEVTSRDAGKAARIADSVAQAIADAQNQRAVEKLTQDRRDAAKAVADFASHLQRAKQRLADVQTGPASSASSDQTASISGGDHVDAAAGLEQAKADIDRISHALLAGWTSNLGELHFPTPELDRLTAQYADLQQQLEKRRLTLGDKHPDLVALEGQLRGLQKDIRSQWQKAADIANHNYRSAQARALAFGHDTPAADVAPDTAGARADMLQTDADLARSDYEHALRWQAKVESSADMLPSWSVAPAQVPVAATHEPQGFILGAVLMLGAMFGAARTWIEKQRGSGRQSLPHKEPSLPVFPIPRIRRDWLGERLKLKPRLDIACREVMDRPRSEFSRAIERLLELATDAVPHGTVKILIVSKEDKSGATTIAVNLAQTAAKAGHRVLLIEANRRRPILASLVSPNVRVNLIDLNGTKRIVCQLPQKFSVIPLFDAQTTIDLEARTHHCLKGINRHFDVVILDGGTFVPDDEMRDMVGAVNRVFHLTPEGIELKTDARAFGARFEAAVLSRPSSVDA